MIGGIEEEKKGGFITEVIQNENEMFSEDNPDAMDSEEEQSNNQIFNVREAIPPTDYDAPYS